jgi:hypothetical protein
MWRAPNALEVGDEARRTIDANNDAPKPFVWTASVEKILSKRGRCDDSNVASVAVRHRCLRLRSAPSRSPPR